VTAVFALAAAVAGLHGVVMRGPIQPVCQVGKPCSEPAVGAVLIFSRNGREAARARAGAGGRYVVRLAPGLYAVRLTTAPRIGSGLMPRQVRVRSGVDARLDFDIDTGIR
jgi:hypothetical protein